MPSPGNLIPVRVRASDGSALQNCLCLTPLNLFSIINSLHFELETAHCQERGLVERVSFAIGRIRKFRRAFELELRDDQQNAL